ncbi:transcriptional regulator [Candidatus Latescibacterota bacterium]
MTLPIDFNGLDTSVHGPIRLGVLTAVHMSGPLDFTSLKKRLQVADGALGKHLSRLESVGYLASRRKLIGRRPRTTYSITRKGHLALQGYLQAMQDLIEAVGDH